MGDLQGELIPKLFILYDQGKLTHEQYRQARATLLDNMTMPSNYNLNQLSMLYAKDIFVTEQYRQLRKVYLDNLLHQPTVIQRFMAKFRAIYRKFVVWQGYLRPWIYIWANKKTLDDYLPKHCDKHIIISAKTLTPKAVDQPQILQEAQEVTKAEGVREAKDLQVESEVDISTAESQAMKVDLAPDEQIVLENQRGAEKKQDYLATALVISGSEQRREELSHFLSQYKISGCSIDTDVIEDRTLYEDIILLDSYYVSDEILESVFLWGSQKDVPVLFLDAESEFSSGSAENFDLKANIVKKIFKVMNIVLEKN